MPNGLAEYGNPVQFYSGGTGIVRYAGGEQHPVGFDAAQYPDGRVLILCQYLEHWPNLSSVNEPDSLSGVLADGTQISAHTLRSTNYLPEIKAEGTYDAFWARSLSARFATTLDVPAELRYAITNVAFTGTARCTSKRGVYRHGLGIPIDLSVNGETESGVLLPVIEYGNRHRRLITLKAHEVTAEFCIEGARSTTAALDNAVGDLCTVLSIARGTRVQWISREEWSDDGRCLQRIHESRPTKPFCPLACIDPRHSGAAATKVFIDRALVA